MIGIEVKKSMRVWLCVPVCVCGCKVWACAWAKAATLRRKCARTHSNIFNSVYIHHASANILSRYWFHFTAQRKKVNWKAEGSSGKSKNWAISYATYFLICMCARLHTCGAYFYLCVAHIVSQSMHINAISLHTTFFITFFNTIPTCYFFFTFFISFFS